MTMGEVNSVTQLLVHPEAPGTPAAPTVALHSGYPPGNEDHISYQTGNFGKSSTQVGAGWDM